MGIIKSKVTGITAGGGIKYGLLNIETGLKYDWQINFNKIAELPKRPSYSGYIREAQVYGRTSQIKLTVGYELN